jgi:ABC-type microcin C transport system duplicated ATPase subunit YejF
MAATTPELSVRDLKVSFRAEGGRVEAVRGVSFEVARGETLAIVGESGSGKSQTVMALMNLLAANGIATGSARYRDQELIGASTATLDKVRGAKLTMIFQEPMTSLDPLYRIGQQMALPIRKHGGLDAAHARVRAIQLLEQVDIRNAHERVDAYPHELSGGQRQRVMIAMALANNPDVLIADEPTTALDVTVEARILALLADLQTRLGMAIIFISHDLSLVRRIADRVIVMRHGEVVESGATAALFDAPQHTYTRMLIDARPKGLKTPIADTEPVVLDAHDLSVTFPGRKALLGRAASTIRAVDGVSLHVRRGETLGIVGESGSGKSTLGRALLKLLPAAGVVRFEDRDLTALDRRTLRPLRREFQVVFQDPFGSLSPRLTAGEIVTEGLLVHAPEINRQARDQRASAAFMEVRLDPDTRDRFPHEFSGGQRQRLAIARAMILRPKLVVLDEPTSALDRSVQVEIVDLLRSLQAKFRLAYVFISHDLAVVRAMADRIIVMKDGAIVEEGSTARITSAPQHPYTQELMRAAFAETAHTR